jgi:hypothetical protein
MVNVLRLMMPFYFPYLIFRHCKCIYMLFIMKISIFCCEGSIFLPQWVEFMLQIYVIVYIVFIWCMCCGLFKVFFSWNH